MKTLITVATEKDIPETKREKFNSKVSAMIENYILQKFKKWGISSSHVISIHQANEIEVTVDEEKCIMATEAATLVQVDHMFSEIADRSEWSLFTLASGEVIFGCFPQKDTFEIITQGKANAPD